MCSNLVLLFTEWDWFNTSRRLSLAADLQGKLVILDFFTYCCINCMHILPELKQLELEFKAETAVLVVGVHSAKFDNEKASVNIKHAVERYEIEHAVVNDSAAMLWSKLEIACWPTLVLLGPQHNVLLVLAGEGKVGLLADVLKHAVTYYSHRSLLDRNPVINNTVTTVTTGQGLLYPGKVALSPSGTRLAISDSGHHRIIVCSIDGTVQVISCYLFAAMHNALVEVSTIKFSFCSAE